MPQLFENGPSLVAVAMETFIQYDQNLSWDVHLTRLFFLKDVIAI